MTATGSVRLQGLAPVWRADARLLVLGSFPGEASLRAQQYYGHPRNQFWLLLGAVWGQDLRAASYAARVDFALAHGIALWDVFSHCTREGSLDSAIRSPQMNDVAGLIEQLPELRAIAHNGGLSARQARWTASLGRAVYRLPSSSPANASWSFDRKLQAWREVFGAAGLLE